MIVSKTGYKKIQDMKNNLSNELASLMSEVTEAAEVGGNLWHDNFMYEQLQVQIRGKEKELLDIKEVIQKVDVLEDDIFLQQVPLGRKFICDINDKLEEWTIVDLYLSDPSKGEIAYNTPLAQYLISAKVGENIIIQIGENNRKIKIIEIDDSGLAKQNE